MIEHWELPRGQVYPGNNWDNPLGVPTVDGSEIRRSPVEVCSLSRYLQGFIHPSWLFGISEPSTVGKIQRLF